MTPEVWRPFALRALWLWMALHALMLVVAALLAFLDGGEPLIFGPGQAPWILTMTATLLGIDITRNRERLLLHDLGVRLRVLIPLAVAPVVLLEAVLVAVILAR